MLIICFIAANVNAGRIRKYVFWCCACGGLATVLGVLFLVVYFLLRYYTSTLGYFETIPTFIPATMVSFIKYNYIIIYVHIIRLDVLV